MAIWISLMTLEQINNMIKGTMDEWIGIRYVEVGDDYLVAQMRVDHRTIQPYGIMHGGASCVLAESAGSLAGNMCVDQSAYYCVGQSIHTNHIRQGTPGELMTSIARPTHLGKKSQLWEIKIENEKKKLVSITRLQLAVLSRAR